MTRRVQARPWRYAANPDSSRVGAANEVGLPLIVNSHRDRRGTGADIHARATATSDPVVNSHRDRRGTGADIHARATATSDPDAPSFAHAPNDEGEEDR